MEGGKRLPGWNRERGASLVLVGVAIVVLLSVLALASDLGILYVARNEAQRAADSAALAGAYTFASSGCMTTGGCAANGAQEAVARQQAIAVGGQNFILGEAASIQNADVSFSYPAPLEPQITVTVSRTAQRQNAVPTVFAKLFSVFQSDVSATATAEAYSGGVANTCAMPFLHAGTLNPTCGAADDPGTNGPAGQFLQQDAQGNWQIKTPGLYPSGIYGEPWTLHFATSGSPGSAGSAVPSHWYMLALSESNSKSDVRTYISECYPKTIACGDMLSPDPGNAVGPVSQGVIERIHASGQGMGEGQDTVDTSTGPPFPIKDASGNTINGVSRSIVTVPIYAGAPLQPGATNRVEVIGFMELFIQDVEKSGNALVVNSAILNVTGCNANGESGGTSTGIPIAVRLIRP
jgi:Flp pilus assembly protein TadG